MPFRGGGGGGGRPGGRRDYGGGGDLDPNAEQFRKLFIGGLSYETDEDSLRGHFETWGEIVDCVVMRDPQSRRSRGFGFITYKDAESVDQAQANRPHKIDSREVDTKRAMPREESGSSESKQSVKKMFVGGVKEDTTEDQVRETFASFGEITQVDMIADKNTGKTRGFCFVSFDDHDSVDKAVLKKRHELNGRQVEVKKAQSKTDMDGGPRGGGGRGRGGMRGGGRGGRQDYNSGGYGGGGYGNGSGYGGGGYGGGYGGQGGYGGGYDSYGSGQGGYGNQGGGWNNSFGSNYGESYGGGAMRSGGGGYGGRSQGPYGGGYGSSGGGGSYGGGYGRR